MTKPETDPAFPEDLERCIFESAAFFHTDCIPALLLVAHRVKIWIEPLFYKAVTIYGLPRGRGPKPNTNFRHSVPALYSLMKSKPASFFSDHVRHVQLVGVPIAEILPALAACNATINLALFNVSCVEGDAALLKLLGEFPLKRLSAPNIIGGVLLALIPRLTHLSFSEGFLCFRTTGVILEHYCKSLQVLAIVFSSPGMLKFIVLNLELQPSLFDPRVALLAVVDRQADWERGARGGNDYWIAAERLVEKQHFVPEFSEDEKEDLKSRELFCQIA
ncbi:hypothetical protein K438DRAFT_1847133 [Mycena galopus ATCC 62051]|nr:hypothetical protein K438DRAFT_1847133 [Mycena galopus ATCC 62051]